MKKVLIIDDEAGFLDAVRNRLDAAGYSVMISTSGEEGIDLARENLPGLILLDLVMPEMNGFFVLSELKKDPRTSAIPVVILTAKDEVEYALDAGKLGASDYLVKPLKLQELELAISKYL